MEFICQTFHSIIYRIIKKKKSNPSASFRQPRPRNKCSPFYLQVNQNEAWGKSLAWLVSWSNCLFTSNPWPRHDPETTGSKLLIRKPPVGSCAASWACMSTKSSSFISLDWTHNKYKRMILECSTKSVNMPWNHPPSLQPLSRGRPWPTQLWKPQFPSLWLQS